MYGILKLKFVVIWNHDSPINQINNKYSILDYKTLKHIL